MAEQHRQAGKKSAEARAAKKAASDAWAEEYLRKYCLKEHRLWSRMVKCMTGNKIPVEGNGPYAVHGGDHVRLYEREEDVVVRHPSEIVILLKRGKHKRWTA